MARPVAVPAVASVRKAVAAIEKVTIVLDTYKQCYMKCYMRRSVQEIFYEKRGEKFYVQEK